MPRGHPRGVGTVLAVLVLVSLAAEAVARQRPLERPPNIVLIIGDDHGWPYSGFMGSRTVATPNLDALAAAGTVFTHVFASGNTCQPSLRTLLSGLEPDAWVAQREGTEVVFGSQLPRAAEVQRFTTLPRLIGRRGYKSFEAGKHWEGTARAAGFTDGGAIAISPPLALPADGFGRPSVDAMASFLDSAGDEPFFLWLAPSVPHVPFDPPAELQTPYRAMGLVETAVLYYANVTRLDGLVGEIIGELRARGLDRETLVVYVSDNGWHQDPDREHYFGTYLGGPRGKASAYELGLRAPTILHWPGRVRSGRRDKTLATFADLNATLLDYADVTLSSQHEGRSLRESAEGRRRRGREFVFGTTDLVRPPDSDTGPVVSRERAAYVRTRRWRYVEYIDRGTHELYRIERDPFEQHDVATRYPRVAARLAERLANELERRAAPSAILDVTGRVRGVFGGPVAGLPVRMSGGGSLFDVWTGADGTFRIPNVPANDYSLIVPAPILVVEGQVQTSVAVPLTDLEAGPHIEFAVLGANFARSDERVGDSEIVGELVDWLGRGFRGLSLHLETLDESGDAVFQMKLMTGRDGRFSMDHLPHGRYRLAVDRVGCKGEWLLDLAERSRLEVRERVRCARPAG